MILSRVALTWEDLYRSTLDEDVKVSVSVGKNGQGEVKSTIAHLRRYSANKFPTKDGITMRTIDLDAIMGSVDGEFSVYTPDHSIVSHATEGKVTIEVTTWGQSKSMEMTPTVYEKVRKAAPGLKFILSSLAKSNKEPVAQKLVKKMTSNIKNCRWYRQFQGNDADLLRELKSMVVESCQPAASTLGINKEMIIAILESEDFEKNATALHEDELEDGFEEILPTLNNNELFMSN